MNCSNCNSPLVPGNNICPNCGFDNSVNQVRQQLEQLTPNDFIELDDNDEKQVITANMAPPTLNVEEENLQAGAGSLGDLANVSTYAPEEQVNEQEQEEKQKTLDEEKVDIVIPSVQTPVQNVDMPVDGTAPEIVEDTNTVGEQTENIEILEEAPKKSKLKLSLAKGSKNVPKNLLIVVVIVFLVIGILLGKAMFSKNYCASNTRTPIISSKTKFVNDGKNNVTNIGTYTYKIPEQYIYDKKNGGLLIYNKEDTFRIFIRTGEGSFEDISGGKNSIRETLRENNVVINNMRELNSGEIEFLVFEGATRSVNRLIAFADAGNNNVFYTEVVTNDNTYNYETLEIIADILKNATYENIESKMEKIDIYDVSDVSIKAATEYKSLTANN